jgi:3-oxosteroid 1-dehydrogenase
VTPLTPPLTAPDQQTLPDRTDVLVIGTGVAGLVAALSAHAAGLAVQVVEKAALLGGNTAMSGGLLWVPNNPLQREDGVTDSAEMARTYLDAVLGEPVPASSPARRAAFVSSGPEMVTFLRSLGIELHRCAGYSDYYPEAPGGVPDGRSVRVATFDLNRLGPWRTLVRPRNLFPGVPIHMEEVADANVASRTWAGVKTVARIAGRGIGGRLRGQRPDSLGGSLIGALLLALLERGVPVHPGTALRDLVVDDGVVTGAVLGLRDGSTRTVTAGSVILAAGGFSQNEVLRKEYGPSPASTEWTLASPDETGDGILAGPAVGAALDLMDEAIWMGTSVRPDGHRDMHLYDRCLPHSIVVDSSGRRFVNESTDYARFGQALYRRNADVPSVPSWLIVDSRHRNRYSLGDIFARLTPKRLIAEGYLHKADTIAGLARSIGVDPEALTATVERFNGFAQRGVDEDFRRGDSHYDRYLADPRTGPNPALGAISKAPFYAVQCFPGDVGTTGGLLTDEHSRVLRADGSVIPGLYAAGTCAATVMGRAYPGPGASIAAGATFGYLAGRHAARPVDAV